MTRTVAVTGAAGKTGRAAVRRLAASLEVSALVHREDQRRAAREDGATRAVAADLTDAGAVAAALAGCDAVYHVPPNMHRDEARLTAVVVHAAERAGVGHLVLHSVLAPYLPSMPHHLRKAEAEALLRGSGLPAWTVLQPASYAQNLLGYADAARRTGVLRQPYFPDAPFTPVDIADVAEVVARVLTGPGHASATYELAGPQRLSSHDMAAALGTALGRPVRAEAQPLEEWRASADLPPGVREDLAAMFAYYDRHGLVGSPWVLERLLGRPATPLAEVLDRELSGS